MLSCMHQPKSFYRRLFLLATPVIIQNLITTSLGFLDTFMVGLLGSVQMSAVTVANVPVFIMQLIVFGDSDSKRSVKEIERLTLN